ncbi:hypothetical protein UFOVP375_21 [uncultured Caudovirales phage]|jgi:hypothetical protein|uniref:Uncharacterized protein n=1 Tax=uncultured Caudovirales phage TaxID=2100421 RepID=A0A6J7XN11_9CAUD|nr:hypothetical protein UFOVP375_21 [uncultured Caudovirales phage]
MNEDRLTPLYVRLRASTIEGLRDAQANSEHRTLAAYVDAILRQHLAASAAPKGDDIARLRQSADKIQREA